MGRGEGEGGGVKVIRNLIFLNGGGVILGLTCRLPSAADWDIMYRSSATAIIPGNVIHGMSNVHLVSCLILARVRDNRTRVSLVAVVARAKAFLMAVVVRLGNSWWQWLLGLGQPLWQWL